MRSIGNRVKSLRKGLRLTQDELAILAGLDQSTISDIESGSGFSATILMKLSKALAVAPEAVMDGSFNPVPNSPTNWRFQRFSLSDLAELTDDQAELVDQTVGGMIALIKLEAGKPEKT